MESHELAKKLLELPNLPVIVEAECILCDYEVGAIKHCKEYTITEPFDCENKTHYGECILIAENDMFI